MTRRELTTTMSRRIYVLRTSRDMDQKPFAKFCGVPQSTISEIERKLHVPSLMTLARICDACGVTVSNLLRGL